MTRDSCGEGWVVPPGYGAMSSRDGVARVGWRDRDGGAMIAAHHSIDVLICSARGGSCFCT